MNALRKRLRPSKARPMPISMAFFCQSEAGPLNGVWQSKGCCCCIKGQSKWWHASTEANINSLAISLPSPPAQRTKGRRSLTCKDRIDVVILFHQYVMAFHSTFNTASGRFNQRSLKPGLYSGIYSMLIYSSNPPITEDTKSHL